MLCILVMLSLTYKAPLHVAQLTPLTSCQSNGDRLSMSVRALKLQLWIAGIRVQSLLQKALPCPQMMQWMCVFFTMVTAVDMETVVTSTHNYCPSLELAKCQKCLPAQHLFPLFLGMASRLSLGKSSFQYIQTCCLG